jgi:hypothetical protein
MLVLEKNFFKDLLNLLLLDPYYPYPWRINFIGTNLYHPYQDWFYLVGHFHRRRLKYENVNDTFNRLLPSDIYKSQEN